jgi:hypothetical protein
VEAIGSKRVTSIRNWRLIAATILFVTMLTGGAAGYALQFVTAPVRTSVQTVQVSDDTGWQCVGLPGRLHGAAC